MKTSAFSWTGGLPLAFALVASATAQTSVETGVSKAEAPRGALGFSQPVAVADLEKYRGGSQSVSNDMTLAGTTADNVAQQVTTGSNAISAGAFANMSGIPVVVQNSGANVLIQNAVILHLQIN